jgi:electron transfer flavoprotein beta subunit
MNIVVLVKQVPDTWAERSLRSSDNTLDRDSVDAVINEVDEQAIEAGLRLKEAHGGEVTILSMGPDRATESIRKALSMGADKGYLISDPALHGACVMQTTQVIAKALGTLEWDIVLTGGESTDARLAILPALLAEATGAAQLTQGRKITVEGSTVSIERVNETGYAVVEGSTPAVVSLLEGTNEARYPSFKGIMAAKKKPLTTVSLGDLGINADDMGLANATTTVVSFENRPPRQSGQAVKDEGDGGIKIADFLSAAKLL